MAFVDIDGIRTHYQIEGNGPALLMFAPGGFDATMDKWRHFGVYQRINLLGHLPDHFQHLALFFLVQIQNKIIVLNLL